MAALTFVPAASTFDVLMITSRRRQRWVMPKGWPMKGLSLPDTAAAEAREEAGIVGPVGDVALGVYNYEKAMPSGYPVQCRVFVYPLLARLHVLAWPERGQRTLRWCPLAEAAELADAKGLGQLLSELAASDGAPMRAFLDQLGAAAQTVDLSTIPDFPDP